MISGKCRAELAGVRSTVPRDQKQMAALFAAVLVYGIRELAVGGRSAMFARLAHETGVAASTASVWCATCSMRPLPR